MAEQETCLPSASVFQPVISHPVANSGSEGALGYESCVEKGRLGAARGVLP